MYRLGAALQRVLGKYMHDLEISTDLERRGELPSGEGVKPVNLVSTGLIAKCSLYTEAPVLLDCHYGWCPD